MQRLRRESCHVHAGTVHNGTRACCAQGLCCCVLPLNRLMIFLSERRSISGSRQTSCPSHWSGGCRRTWWLTLPRQCSNCCLVRSLGASPRQGPCRIPSPRCLPPAGEGIPKFNIHAVQRLDHDLLLMEDFATCLSVDHGHDLKEEFASLRCIVDLLLSNEVRLTSNAGVMRGISCIEP